MTTTPHTNAEALVKHLTGGGYDYRHVQEAAAMLRAQAQEIERLTPLQYRQAPCHKFCESNAYEIELRNEQAKTFKAQVEYKTISALNDTLRTEVERLQADAVRYSYKAMEESIKADKAEIARLTQQCKLFDAAAYKARIEARVLIKEEQSENKRLLDLLDKAESILSDYYVGAEWGKYDLDVLQLLRAELNKQLLRAELNKH